MRYQNEFIIENGILKEYIGPGGDVIVPEGVKGIGNYAFYGRREVTSIAIPNSVTFIGEEVFWACDKLSNLVIPDSVTSIGKSAFRGCYFWADENGFVIFKNVLYDYVGPGGDVIIPENVCCIGDRAFYNMLNISSVRISGSVVEIGKEAFFACDGLQRVILLAGVKIIRECAFLGCRGLVQVIIPCSVIVIEKDAFCLCDNITDLRNDSNCCVRLEGVFLEGVD